MSGGDGASILPLRFEQVRFAVRGVPLLGPLTFALEAGTRSVVLGPNGAGKSLTLRIAHGLLAPSSGRVRWEGKGVAGAQRRQAMVFERPVHLRRSVRANVDYALAVRGIARAERRERTDAVLERTGLLPLARRAARALSSGEQQRLAIARAWALEPEVLFLDEPTGALDPSATRRIEELIARIASEGSKIVMTTHDLGQARRLADEVLFLHGGRLCERAPADAFFEAARTPEARAFLKGDLLW